MSTANSVIQVHSEALRRSLEYHQPRMPATISEGQQLLPLDRSLMHSFWTIRSYSLFGKLNDDELAYLEKHSRKRVFRKSSTIYAPNDESNYAFLLVKGRIRIGNSTGDGKEMILAYVEPGELFGELSVIDESYRQDRAEAAVESTVLAIPSDCLINIMERNGSLAIGISKLIGLRRKRIETRLQNLLFRSNRQRLCALLVELSEQYGVRESNRIVLRVKFTHQELASIIGVTREAVTLLLGQLRGAKLIELDGKTITIPNPIALRGECEQ